MIKAVLFDLDGTLLDTSEGIKHSVRYTISKLGYGALPEDTILKFIGPPIQNSLITYCGVDEKEAQKGANIFRNFYKTEALFEARIYDGIIKLLQDLKSMKIKIGVATYKREDYAIDLLRHFAISNYCDVIHGADNENRLTKADIVENCINELGIKRHEVMLVGDTDHDAKGAAEAGVPFVAVTYGFGFIKDSFDCEYPFAAHINEAQELVNVIFHYV